MKITYNAPVILTFTFISVIVQLMPQLIIRGFFAVGGEMDLFSPLDYLRLFTHIFGHADWIHLFNNFALILLIGPIIEEKYGSFPLMMMMGLTAVVTGVLNVALFDTGLYGASGIVFMLILLGSVTNAKSGTIPLTFILVVLIYVGQEVFSIFSQDNISQFGHIMGGIAGSIFGFAFGSKDSTVSSTEKSTNPYL